MGKGTGDSGNQVSDTALALIEEQAEQSIRRVWHDDRWYFSVIDVIGLLTDSTYPNRYWSDLKRKLAAEGATQPYEKIVRLKMTAPDGKQRVTDAAYTETLLRIIQSVPSPKAEPVKQWLARVGAAFARIRGYLSTLRKQGVERLAALESLFTGRLLYPSFG